MLGAGGPDLLSVDDIIVAVTHRGRPQCERVGARRRFGDAERLQTKRARRDLRQIMLLLLLATVAQHGIHDVHLRVASRSVRSEEHTSELQSLIRISYAVLCLNTKKK